MSRASRHSSAVPSPAHGGHHDEHNHPGLSIAVEKQKGKADVRVTVAAEDLERARGQEYATLARRVVLKGFRPGKTPRAMLEKHYAAEVERGVAEHFLQHAYQQAVAEHQLRPAAYPRIPLEDNLPKKGEAWSVSFEILLRPELTLGQVEGLEIEGQDVSVDDPELDRALAEIRRANSRAEPAGEEPLEAGGMAVATLDFFRPASEESCLSREGIRLSPKNPPQGVDPATFEETLTGARVGETRSMEMVFPPNFPLEEARGEKGTVRFTLKEVLRIVPPPDEEFFKAFEVGDEAGLREAVRARMLKAKQEAEEERIETALLERVIDEHPMDLPPRIVEDQVEAHQQELREKLKEQGLGEDEAKARAEEERERSHLNAVKSLKAVYLIEEIARAKELQVTEQDVTGEIQAIAARNGTEPAEVAKYYREQSLLRQLGLELLERKVRTYLRTSASIRRPA